jgi:prepilin-type N-terminal cleavage/methylation domain-containing protein
MVNKSKKAFTLIEIMIVMAIIAVLSVLIVGAITVARNTAKEAAHRTNAKSVIAGFYSYYASHRQWPAINKSFEGAASQLGGINLTPTPECTITNNLGGGGIWYTPATPPYTGFHVVVYAANCSSVLYQEDY